MLEPNKTERRAQFVAHFSRYRSQLFTYIHTVVRNLADADDVFQQTALALWRRFDTYDPTRSFLNWALGVARLEAIAWLRARARDRVRFSDELTLLLLDAFASLPEEETSTRLDALPGCVDKLPESDLALIRECYNRAVDVATVAARLGRSAQSVHNSLARIRRALHDCIERAIARADRETA
jgi:RNA polymerase sigma-70 factor (ECF subfamily)